MKYKILTGNNLLCNHTFHPLRLTSYRSCRPYVSNDLRLIYGLGWSSISFILTSWNWNHKQGEWNLQRSLWGCCLHDQRLHASCTTVGNRLLVKYCNCIHKLQDFYNRHKYRLLRPPPLQLKYHSCFSSYPHSAAWSIVPYGVNQLILLPKQRHQEFSQFK